MLTLKKRIVDVYIKILRSFVGIDRNQVLFQSFSGKNYSDNPRAISEQLHEISPNTRIIWAFSDPSKMVKHVPAYVGIVDKNKPLKYYLEITRSKVVIDNNVFRIPKRHGQRFLQTWHGDRAFKKILYDSNYYVSEDYLESHDGFCDLAIAGSDYGVNQYRSGFHYKGEILTCGLPRNDVLLKDDAQPRSVEIKRELNMEDGVRILLYAPTLRRINQRGRGNQQIQDIDIGKTLDALEKHDGCKWICLMRAHPNMSGLAGFDVSERIMDVSRYEDMADLLLVSDMLITDYSSCAGDFALTHRPIILYQSDRQEYQEKDREFYFNMEDSPYMIAENQQELEDLISRLDDETVRENCDEILRFYNTTESGEAAAAVARRIVEWINEA